MHIFKNTNFDFLKYRWPAIAVSWIIILAGVFAIWTKGIPKGVEFAGGTVVITQFDQAVSVQQVRAALDKTFPGADTVVQSYGDPQQNQVMVRVPTTGQESGSSLSKTQDQIKAALTLANRWCVEELEPRRHPRSLPRPRLLPHLLATAGKLIRGN